MSRFNLSICFFLFCFPLTGSTQTNGKEYYDFKFKQIADNIYVAYRPEPLRIEVQGNVSIIINDNDVVVVDASGGSFSANLIINEIKRLTSKPVRYLINTHTHGDHTNGNTAFSRAFPGLEIIASRFTRDGLARRIGRVTSPAKAEEGNQANIKAIEQWIKDVEKEAAPGYQKTLANFKEWLDHDITIVRKEQLVDTIITAPTMVVDQNLTLYGSGREIQILTLGKGDTEGDLWVYLPKEKILMSGDALVGPVPFGFSNFTGEWINTLKKAAAMDFTILVPGHGDIQYDKSYINQVIGVLEFARTKTKEGMDQGMALEDIQSKTDMNEWELKFTGDDPVKRFYFFRYFRRVIYRQMMSDLKKSKTTAGKTQ
jgi:cyclase